MPDGINYELDFEKRIGEMGDRQLLEFVARQVSETTLEIKNHNDRITALEKANRRVVSIAGAITGLVAALVVALINWLVRG